MSTRGVKWRLPLISFPNAHQMIGVTQVQLGEELSFLECGEGGGDEWDGVAVLDGNVI